MARKRGDARQRLFDAAISLIGERGFHGTSVDDIVEAAGVAKGTVYYHFKGGKEEMVAALLEDGLRMLSANFRATVQEASGPRDALVAIVRTEVDYVSRYQAFSKLLVSEMWRRDRSWRHTVRLLREEYVTVISDVLAAGVAEGSFRADLDAEVAAWAIFGMIATATLDWLEFNPSEPGDHVIASLQAMALGSVGAS